MTWRLILLTELQQATTPGCNIYMSPRLYLRSRQVTSSENRNCEENYGYYFPYQQEVVDGKRFPKSSEILTGSFYLR
jgi:hypothetical protein